MQLGGLNVVDPKSIVEYHLRKRISTELIQRCNCQEFRYIDGFGKGYFLMTQDISTESASFTWGSRTVDLKIVDILSLEEIGFSGTGLKLYKTAEPKYLLKDSTVDRNYNITIDKSLNQYGATTIITMAPDDTPKTLKEVMTDFLSVPISYFADNITSFDIAIEGLSHLAAMDHLCSIYGLIWTYDGTRVYVWDMDSDADSSSAQTATVQRPYNAIAHSELSDDISDINVVFPIYEYCRKEESERVVVGDNTTDQGAAVNVFDPYYPAVVNSLGTVRNQALLDTRADLIEDNLHGIEAALNYLERHHAELNPLSTRPLSLSEIACDMGRGPRTIHRQIVYPFCHPPNPKAKSRLANNWVGTLTAGYFGEVSYFVVTPAFGLDGQFPPGDQIVYNIYSWDYGEPGWLVRVEWDCSNQRWIPIQQEYDCPPTEDPNYEAPGPTEDYPAYPGE